MKMLKPFTIMILSFAVLGVLGLASCQAVRMSVDPELCEATEEGILDCPAEAVTPSLNAGVITDFVNDSVDKANDKIKDGIDKANQSLREASK